MTARVFEGIRVAEFAWTVVGPASSRYLADHGATVVKIESHTRLDTLKGTSPFPTGRATLDGSMCYGRYNANKYSVSLDLEHPEGRQLAWKFIEWADIVTESFSPRVMQKWGLDYPSVSKIKPDIIYLSSSMQGRGGPHSGYTGYGHNACALSGFTELSGWPDDPPAAPYGPYTDFICPRFNATALIAALDYRRRTGQGQWLEQSQFETALQFLAPVFMDYAASGRVARRRGNRLAEATPHGVFPCRGEDSWLAIAVFSEADWDAFVRAIGNPAWAQGSDFATLEKRKENEDRLEEIVAAWTSRYTAAEAEQILQAAGVAASAVQKPSDIYADPQLEHRRYFSRLEHPVMGPQAFEPQACFILSETPREVGRPSPCLGEHNGYVFKELLGLTDDEIAERIADGSITTTLPYDFQVRM
jgi:benzylsuccinate CoA-transferase BbsF subunit